MNLVYKVIGYDGKFAAFKQCDDKSFSYFLPSSSFEQFSKGSIDQWNTVRTYYKTEADFDLYDEVINAAAYFLSIQNMYFEKSKVITTFLEPGSFYPRIWRGHYSTGNIFSNYNAVPAVMYGNEHVQSVVAAASLYDYLLEIFRYIEPATKNSSSFGHKIRELLILACTEIESAWRGVLEKNTAIADHKQRYTTKDYFRVKEPLRLNEWSLVLKDYPDFPVLSPFQNWSDSAPTTSLHWYNVYNKVKHHREAEFHNATFHDLLNAMAALHIMQLAQWGPEVYTLFKDNRISPFTIKAYPQFSAADIYIQDFDDPNIMTETLYFK